MSDVEKESQFREILVKDGAHRSYDDLLVMKARICHMEFFHKVFSSLHPRQVDELCKNMSLESFDIDTTIFKQGDRGDKFYIVFSGACDIKVQSLITDSHNGLSEMREKTLFNCKCGGHFGERALEFNEPRAATIVTTSFTELLTITKNEYMRVKKLTLDLVTEGALDPNSKASVIRVLSKARDKRTEADLLCIDNYLERRNSFFQKFNADQRMELCRVLELVSIYGKNTLFKQGSNGQAFYIILSGTVDIYVNTTLEDGNERSGLDGQHVNTLVQGSSFGERALESASNSRTATVVTGLGCTELLVICREDYDSLVSVMMHGETAFKCSLLRKTLTFKDVDFTHLTELANFMEHRLYHIDSYLCKAGSPVTDLIIVAEGEGFVDIEVETEPLISSPQKHSLPPLPPLSPEALPTLGEAPISSPSSVIQPDPMCVVPPPAVTSHGEKSTDGKTNKPHEQRENSSHSPPNPNHSPSKHSRLSKHTALKSIPSPKKGSKEKIALGRIGPGAVIGLEIAHCSSFVEEAVFKETIIAQTICSVYIIPKYDFFHQVALQTRTDVAAHIVNDKPPVLSELWDCRPRALGINEWRIQKSWMHFRQDVNSQKKDASILANYRKYRAMCLTANSGNMDAVTYYDPYAATDTVYHKQAKDFIENLRKDEEKAATRRVNKLLSKTAHSVAVEKKVISSMELQKEMVSSKDPRSKVAVHSTMYQDVTPESRHPFCLIHFHREKVAVKPEAGPRRVCRCHFRLCGTMASCAEAITTAKSLMLHAFINLLDSDITRADEVYLNWKQFHTFEGIPLHHSDHFIVFCRTAPVEYASFTTQEDFLLFNFPSPCKPAGQRFATITVKPLINLANPLQFSTASKKISSKKTKEQEKVLTNKMVLARKPSYRGRGTDGMAALNAGNDDEDSDTDSDDFDEDKEDDSLKYPSPERLIVQPFFLKEISFVGEVVQCTSSAVEALRFAKLQVSTPVFDMNDEYIRSPVPLRKEGRVCVIPMFQWLAISEDVISRYDRNSLAVDSVEDIATEMPCHSKVHAIAQAHSGAKISASSSALAVKKLNEAFSEAGIPTGRGNGAITGRGFHNTHSAISKNSSKSTAVASTDQHITSDVSFKMLNREMERKKLHDEIVALTSKEDSLIVPHNGRQAMSVDKLAKNKILQDEKESRQAANSAVLQSEQRYKDRMSALKIKTDKRSKLLQWNHEVCQQEKNIHREGVNNVNSQKLQAEMVDLIGSTNVQAAGRFNNMDGNGVGDSVGVIEEVETKESITSHNRDHCHHLSLPLKRESRQSSSGFIIEAVTSAGLGSLHQQPGDSPTKHVHPSKQSLIDLSQGRVNRKRIDLLHGLLTLPSKKETESVVRGKRLKEGLKTATGLAPLSSPGKSPDKNSLNSPLNSPLKSSNSGVSPSKQVSQLPSPPPSLAAKLAVLECILNRNANIAMSGTDGHGHDPGHFGE